MSDILDLSGKVALVTGAGQGVGQQIALHFANHNVKGLIVNDYNLERAEETVALIKELNGPTEAIAIQADVSNWQSIQEMTQKAYEKFDRIDILVNNAGNAGASTQDALGQQKTFVETDPDEWETWIGVNYYGPMYTTRAVLPKMIENNYGKIVNIISDAGRVGEPRLVVYSGAKAGAAGFTRGLAKEVGRFNITANCIALSTMNTGAVAALTSNEGLMKKVLRNYPMNRIGETTDAANAVLFLSSDASSWITGQTYPVNGGFSTSQ